MVFSLLRCHNFAGPDKIKIMVVSPTDPTIKEDISAWVEKEALSYDNWVKTVKGIVDEYKSNNGSILKDLQDSDLTFYMRTTYLGGHLWYSSHGVALALLRKKVPIQAPEFIVTGSEVGRKQRRGCCCSKGVTVRLPLDPGDDHSRT
eukprot:GHVU01005447.1.p1 GENE.GHVU01005447.1~~GHVU01005447.1.p1  ORF type:complete len:147 (-),score=5.96 GHVU01005447.1:11-451(-)